MHGTDPEYEDHFDFDCVSACISAVWNQKKIVCQQHTTSSVDGGNQIDICGLALWLECPLGSGTRGIGIGSDRSW